AGCMKWSDAAKLLVNDPSEFARRVPHALRRRWHKRWDPIGCSEERRALTGGLVWARRSLGGRRRTLVLRFANAHRARIPELDWFAEEVDRVSAGAVRISFVDGWTTRDHPTEETATVAAVGHHQADLGW